MWKWLHKQEYIDIYGAIVDYETGLYLFYPSPPAKKPNPPSPLKKEAGLPTSMNLGEKAYEAYKISNILPRDHVLVLKKDGRLFFCGGNNAIVQNMTSGDMLFKNGNATIIRPGGYQYNVHIQPPAEKYNRSQDNYRISERVMPGDIVRKSGNRTPDTYFYDL